MVYLIWVLIILTAVWVGINDNCEKLSDKTLVSIIYISVFAAIILFTHSNFVCNIHMKAYEEGRLEKVYTIKGSDTTYKWVYHEKD